MTHDKPTEGRTEAAAVDQAIADVREALGNALAIMRGLMTDPKVTRTTDLTPEIEECSSALAALRVLADAVEKASEKIHRLQFAEGQQAARAREAEAERDRLARQVADLKADRANATELLDDLLLSFAADMDSDAMVEKRVQEIRAALDAARSRDPQEPTHDPSATPFSRPALQSNEAGLFGHDHVPGDPQEGA